jgi:hypothetical protein
LGQLITGWNRLEKFMPGSELKVAEAAGGTVPGRKILCLDSLDGAGCLEIKKNPFFSKKSFELL